MKKHTQVLLLFLLGFLFSANAQRISRTTTEAGNVYPLISATNVASMFTMTLGDWERGMKLITKVRDDFGELGISYTCEAKPGTNDGFCFVTKKTDAVEIVYNLGPNKIPLFTKMIAELEKDYVKEVDGYKVYTFEHTDAIEYIFLIKVTADTEYVKVYLNTQK